MARFLAVAMRNDFGMGAMAIGVVLGARTFDHQGMFLFGGALFSPVLQSLVGTAAEGNRSTLFALLVICGEVGVVVGPLLGSLFYTQASTPHC